MDKSEFYRDARNDLAGPLSGVTVVEATTTWAGPMAAEADIFIENFRPGTLAQ